MDSHATLRDAVMQHLLTMQDRRPGRVEESLRAWHAAYAIFQRNRSFALADLALFDVGLEALKALVARCDNWPGPAKALADAEIFRAQLVVQRELERRRI